LAHALPVVRTAHPLTDPIALIVSFYAMVEQVAVARGINPDAPRHLRKVTQTV
jgi:glucosamine--fructose-6-phosphate aminotransferase (isomerizing)